MAVPYISFHRNRKYVSAFRLMFFYLKVLLKLWQQPPVKSEQWPTLYNDQPDPQLSKINSIFLPRNNPWTTTPFEEQPLILNPKGGRCTQVWQLFFAKLKFAEFRIKFSEFSYASCADAFWSGRTNPGPGQPLRILLYDGSYVNCSIENLLNGKTDCPVGWFGSADNEFCFQVNQDLVVNEEAARYLT